MKNGLFEKRIPTVFALVILLTGLLVTSLLVKQGVFTSSHATPNEEPQNIQVSNVTDTSFTVTFTTLDPTVAGVSVLNSNPPTVYYDARNTEGGKSYISHFITVRNLFPQTKYTFSVLSNGETYLDHGKNFTATTTNVHIPVSSAALKGNVLLPDGLPGNDVLIIATIADAQKVSAVTDDAGNYFIPMSLITGKLNGELLTLAPNTKVVLRATKALLTSLINYQYEPKVNIPTISLSSNYSFTASEQETQLSTPSSNLSVPNGPRKTDVKIMVPQENQSFTDLRPQFQGTAGPNALVRIVIHSDTVNVEVRSNPNGNWTYRPAVALSAGSHTITVTAESALGIIKTVTTPFTVLASGSQIAESATPSATLAPTATITLTATPTLAPTVAQTTPSPTPVTVGTIAPTVTLAPSPTVTVIPTDTPIPTAIAIIPPKAQIPPTGDTTQAIFLTTMSLLFIVSGSVLLFIL